jgi:hypothetical protein
MKVAYTSEIAVFTRWSRTKLLNEGSANAARMPSTVTVISSSTIVNPLAEFPIVSPCRFFEYAGLCP